MNIKHYFLDFNLMRFSAFKRFLTALVFLLFLTNSTKVEATHIMGGDFTWECIEPGKYLVRYKHYRDCRGIPHTYSLDFNIRCVETGATTTIAHNQGSRVIRDLTPFCSKMQKGACDPPNTMTGQKGVEEHYFETTLDFTTGVLKQMRDNGCCRFQFSTSICCRNGNPNLNINDYANFYTDSEINLCNIEKSWKKCDNGPDLKNPPVAVICCNQPFHFNNGVIDLDGDSLVFALANPLSGPGVTIGYKKPGLGFNWPMTPYCRRYDDAFPRRCLNNVTRPNAKPPEGFYFDSKTGDMVFQPTDCDEEGVIAIRIDQYRLNAKGDSMLHLGYTMRDLQIWVEVCSDNNPPIIQDAKIEPICEGEKICVTIEALDEEYNGSNGQQPWKDTIDLSWNKTIPGATWEVDSPKFINNQGIIFAYRSAKLCWQTKFGDGREQPYPFAVTAKDLACPRNAISSRGFNIKVNRSATADREYENGECGKFYFKSKPHDTFFYRGNYQHDWTIRDSTNAGIPIYRSSRGSDSLDFRYGGKYIITYIINNPPINCPVIYSDTIEIPPQVEIHLPNDTFVCEGNNITLISEIKNGTSPFKTQWYKPYNTISIPDTFSNIQLSPIETIQLAATVTDIKGCVGADTSLVTWIRNPRPDLGPDQRICSYDSVILKPLNYQNDSVHTFRWSFFGLPDDSIVVRFADKYSLRVTDTLGCHGSDTMELFVNQRVISRPGPDRGVCIFDTIEFAANRTPLNYPGTYRWRDITGVVSINLGSDSAIKQSWNVVTQRDYELYVEVTQAGLMCHHADTFNLTVWPLPVLTSSPVSAKCYDYGPINLNGPDGPQPNPKEVRFYHENPNKQHMISGGPNPYPYFYETFKLDPVPKVEVRDTVWFDYTDSNGCYNNRFERITINPNPTVSTEKNRIFCQDVGSIRLNPIGTPQFGGTREWRCIAAPVGVTPSDPTLVQNVGSQFSPDWRLRTGIPGVDNHRLGFYTLEYCYTVTQTGCRSCDTTVVEILKLPEIQFTAIPNQCINFDTLYLQKHVNLTGGKWWVQAPAGMGNRVADSSKFLPFLGSGPFTLGYVHTLSGCPVDSTINLNVSTLPQIRLNIPDTVCSSGGPLTLTRANGFILQPDWNGNANGRWVEKNANGDSISLFLSGTRNEVFSPNKSPLTKQYEGPYTLRFNYTFPLTGCSNSDSVLIRVQSQPTIEILNLNPLEQCEFTPFQLGSKNEWASTITWSADGDGMFDNPKLNGPVYTHGVNDTATGQVMVYVSTDPEGVCPIAQDSSVLLIRPYPQFDFTADTLEGCQPLTVNFNSMVVKPTDGDVSYQWNFDLGNGGSTDANPTNIVFKDAKDYTIKLKVTNNKAGCETEIDKIDYIKVYPVPVASFRTNPNYYSTVALTRFRMTNESKIEFGDMSYFWDFGTGNDADTSNEKNPIFIYPQDTAEYVISLFVESDKGCFDSTSLPIKIGPDVTVYIPNAFSPDGAGPERNNRFYVTADGIIDYHLRIFNRWGEQMWESKDQFEGWDGKFKGVDCIQDVYIYYLEVVGFDGTPYEYSGTITLLR
jgi:PKD repeat protein